MADTSRTVNALYALLADNTTSKIKAQTLRDLLKSLTSGYGSLWIQHGTSPSGISIETYAKPMVGFTSSGISSGVTPVISTSTLIPEVDGVYDLFFQGSYAGSASQTFHFHARKNGVEIPGACCDRKLGVGGDVGSCSFELPVVLTSGVGVRLWLNADDSGKEVTPISGQLSLTRIG